MYYKSVKYFLISASVGLLIGTLPIVSQANIIRNKNTEDSQTKIIKHKDTDDMVPTGKGWGTLSAYPPARVSDKIIPQNGIFYHGGPVMGTTNDTIPNVYLIWYGNWEGNSAINIITNLVKGIGESPYYHINSTYVDANNQPVLPTVNVPTKGVFDNYSKGHALSDQDVIDVVAGAINSNSLPLDNNGIYFVLTSADVDETSGFCSEYCGYHSVSKIKNTNIKYAFVGDSGRCLDGCAAQTISPNNNPGADAMASVIAHELEEAVTDPNLNAWYDKHGQENADKCAWTFGDTQNTDSGAKYNLTIGGLKYLIQQNWVNDRGGFCAMSF